jgi:hypothetical protein
VPRKGCVAAPAILRDAKILGPLGGPFATQGRSYQGQRTQSDFSKIFELRW